MNHIGFHSLEEIKMVLKTVEDKHPFCPQCGKNDEKVTLKVDEWGEYKDTKHKDYYICCGHCERRWYIVNFGVWSETNYKMGED